MPPIPTSIQWIEITNEALNSYFQRRNAELNQIRTSSPERWDQALQTWNQHQYELSYILAKERQYQLRDHKHLRDEFCKECSGLLEECDYCYEDPCDCCHHEEWEYCAECSKNGDIMLLESCEMCDHDYCQNCKHVGHTDENYCEYCCDEDGFYRLKRACDSCNGVVCDNEDHNYSD